MGVNDAREETAPGEVDEDTVCDSGQFSWRPSGRCQNVENVFKAALCRLSGRSTRVLD